MSKVINLLNQIKKVREPFYAITAGDTQFTVYEPLTKNKRNEELDPDDFNPKEQSSFNGTKLLIALYIALGILFLAYSYIMTVAAKQNVALMEQSYRHLSERFDTLQGQMINLQGQLKDSSINMAFEINSLEHNLEDTKNKMEEKQNHLLNQYQTLENKITSSDFIQEVQK
jgi:flagellar capping protein FliD